MPSDRPWWAQKPGRWDERLEDALASDDERRRGLAWSIILNTGGVERGIFSTYAETVGVGRSNISGMLSGSQAISRQFEEKVRLAFDDAPHIFALGAHPLGVKLPGGSVVHEPGDPVWRAIWSNSMIVDKTLKSPETLQLERPDLFPHPMT